MTARGWARLGVAAGLALPAAPAAAQGLAPAIAWEAGAGSAAAVLVLHPPAATADALRDAPAGDPRWAATLAVRVVDPDGTVPPDRPAIAGAYRVDPAGSLRFTPRFPLEVTRAYRATFDPDGAPGGLPSVAADLPASRRADRAAPTVVARIEPTGDRPPENLLRFYLHFSAPMARGEALARLRLLDDAGKPLDRPFLALGEELWDPTQTRLTVLLDPGRIKQGLRPREEFGPILVAGRAYTLAVDPGWPDADGRPLGRGASKTFVAGPADDASPDPKTWTIARPAPGSAGPLRVTFADPLDRATVASGLTLLDPAGAPVPGTAIARPDGTGWDFAPDRPWAAGVHHLAINPDLEDLAGNSIRRPFEVDIQRDTPTAPEPTEIRLPIAIGR